MLHNTLICVDYNARCGLITQISVLCVIVRLDYAFRLDALVSILFFTFAFSLFPLYWRAHVEKGVGCFVASCAEEGAAVGRAPRRAAFYGHSRGGRRG